MSSDIRSGLRVGVIFGIIYIFLVLTGFTMTASLLIHEGLRLGELAPDSGSIPGLLIFLGLLGVWAGILTARNIKPTTFSRTSLAGLTTGITSWVLFLLIILISGFIYNAGIDTRKYLTQLSPQALELILLNRSTAQASGIYLALLVGGGIVGGLITWGVGQDFVRRNVNHYWDRGINFVRNQPIIIRTQKNKYTRIAFYIILLGFLLLLPQLIGKYWNYTLGTVGIYVLMGLGLNIVVGLAGLLDLGYVAFFAVGAYTMGLLTSPAPHGLLWNFWVVLPIAVLVAAFAGILLGIPVLRLRGDYLAIVTLGFGEIIRILAKSDLLSEFAGGPQGVRDIGGPSFFGNPLTNERHFIYLIIISILLVIFVTNRLQSSSIGRAWIAMREDETVAQAIGINTYQAKILAFAMGAAFAGLGGVLFASRNQYTGPEDHTLMVSINVLCLVIVGGMASIPGVIAGAFVLKGLPEVLRQLEDYRILAFGALLVIMMIVRPEGIIPSQRRRLEMRRPEPDEMTGTLEKVSGVSGDD